MALPSDNVDISRVRGEVDGVYAALDQGPWIRQGSRARLISDHVDRPVSAKAGARSAITFVEQQVPKTCRMKSHRESTAAREQLNTGAAVGNAGLRGGHTAGNYHGVATRSCCSDGVVCGRLT